MRQYHIELNSQGLVEKGIKATIDFYATLAIEQLSLPGLNAFVTGVDSPFLNVVIDTQKNTLCSPEFITAVETFFNRQQVPWAWFVTSMAKTTGLDDTGFTFLEEMPGMYFNLKDPLPNIPTEFIKIQELPRGDDLSTWIQPIYEGFGGSNQDDTYRRLNANLLQKGEKN